MSTIAECVTNIRNARKAKEVATDELDEAVAKLRSICTHEKVCECECEYEPQSPPKRKCEICGFEEEGWGVGYKTLKTPYVRSISRCALDHILPGVMHF